MVADLKELEGKTVTAKRLGWDEKLTAEQELDLDPFEGGDDLRGELVLYEVKKRREHPGFTMCLVDGKEADPETVELSDPTENAWAEYLEGGADGGSDADTD